MLKRAVKHADAVVVPTHAMAVRLAEIAKLGERIRVIAGAAPEGFAVPRDDVGRRRELDLPEGFVLLSGHHGESLGAALSAVARSGVDLPVVVIGAAEGEEPTIADQASAAGIPERSLHVRGALSGADRAAVFAGAVAFVVAISGSRCLGVCSRRWPSSSRGGGILARERRGHRRRGAVVDADPEALGAALADALGTTAAATRLGVLAADRGRAFPWLGAADRVWQLHAEL